MRKTFSSQNLPNRREAAPHAAQPAQASPGRRPAKPGERLAGATSVASPSPPHGGTVRAGFADSFLSFSLN